MTEPNSVVVISRMKIQELAETVNVMAPKEITELLESLDLDVLKRACIVLNIRRND